MSLIKIFDTDINFWELHPSLKKYEPFSELRKKDRSRSKKNSSDCLWFVALCYDFDSDYIRLPEEDRLQLIGTDFFNDVDFIKHNKLDDVIKGYNKLQDTPARRQLREVRNKLDEKTMFMAVTLYNSETWEMLEKQMGSNVKIYSDLARLEKQVEREKGAGKVKGGAHASMMDEMKTDEH